MKFKKGDKVRRIKSDHCGMSVGDTDIVKKYECDSSMNLEHYYGSHAPYNFEKVETSWRARYGQN